MPLVGSLEEFRAWARSDECPDNVRVDYIRGRIEVDMSPEDLFTHGNLKTRIVAVVEQLVWERDLGEVFSDSARLSSLDADLSSQPDLVYVSDATLETDRVRLVPKATGEADRFVELEGAPDLVVEIVSDSSVTKDTERLPEAYWRAGIPEFWLADARGSELFFRIHRPGSDGYEAAPVTADGFQHSAVFQTWFRLTRHRRRSGWWKYDLEKRSG